MCKHVSSELFLLKSLEEDLKPQRSDSLNYQQGHSGRIEVVSAIQPPCALLFKMSIADLFFQ